MSDLQLYLAIGVPVVLNGIIISIAVQVLGQRITSLETRMETRFGSLETRFELLQGAVYELDKRVAIMEDRRK